MIFGSLFLIGLYATQRVIGHYVDDIQRAETDLHLAKDAAESANRAKSDFLARMSHELRTPLNGILGYTQLMKRDSDLDDAHREGASVIQKSGEHLLNLINDILDLSKIEARRMELRMSDFNLRDFLRDIVDLFSVRAQEEGLSFAFEVSSTVPGRIRSDEQKLRQVLINLLANAVKFTEDGDVRLIVERHQNTLKEGHDNGTESLSFHVSDTGIGMTPDQLETIFQPFAQVEQESRTMEGTGLGLSISHEFVRMMGGNLSVTSQQGDGTTFSFTLVVEVSHNADVTELSSAPSKDVPAAASHSDPVPPEEVVETLLSLARRGDIEELGKELESVRQSDTAMAAFVDRLSGLVKRYEISAIRDELKSRLNREA